MSISEPRSAEMASSVKSVFITWTEKELSVSTAFSSIFLLQLRKNKNNLRENISQQNLPLIWFPNDT